MQDTVSFVDIGFLERRGLMSVFDQGVACSLAHDRVLQLPFALVEKVKHVFVLGSDLEDLFLLLTGCARWRVGLGTCACLLLLLLFDVPIVGQERLCLPLLTSSCGESSCLKRVADHSQDLLVLHAAVETGTRSAVVLMLWRDSLNLEQVRSLDHLTVRVRLFHQLLQVVCCCVHLARRSLLVLGQNYPASIISGWPCDF